MKSTSRPPPLTKEEMEKDIDLDMDFGLEPPKLSLPDTIDPLYVVKPIGPYEPMNQSSRKRANKGEKGHENENRIIRKKFKPEPTT